MPANDFSADIRQRAARIKLACFDVDGTLTDGRLYFDSNGVETKAFHVHDGLGLVLLRKAGITVALVTARTSPVAEQRAAELGIEAHTGVANKLACVTAIAERLGISLDQVAFMGDDLPDLKIMPHVGLSAAPGNAHHWVSDRVHWSARAAGGEGAAREFCEVLLESQGQLQHVLDDVLATGAAS